MGVRGALRAGESWLWFRILLIALILSALYQVAVGHQAYLWFYLIPPTVYFCFGHVEGSVWAAGALLGCAVVMTLFDSVGYSTGTVIRFLCSFALSSVLAFEMELRRRHHARHLLRNKGALEQAAQDLETLQGFLPICVYCKSIRDDQGYWSSLGGTIFRAIPWPRSRKGNARSAEPPPRSNHDRST